jgi:DNA polymerase (family 10)
VNKRHIARILDEIAFFLLLKGENPYRARAYRNAGLALLTYPEDVQSLVESGTLPHIKGIGPATASVIMELVTTGDSTLHRELRASYPASLKELSDVPGLRLKQIQRLYERAAISSLADLQVAVAENHLLAIPGLGPQVQEKVRAALGQYERGQGYHLYANVLDEAIALEKALERIPDVRAVSLAGALRRKLEVVHDLSFVTSTNRPQAVPHLAASVRAIPNVTEVSEHLDTVTARSPLGLPVVIKITTPQQHGFALLQATGSPEHLEDLRQRLSEQGLPDWDALRARLEGTTVTEETIYRAAELPFIQPELREGRGEIATADQMPSLIEPTQIQGFFHAHTLYTDGAGTVEEMVAAARELGYRYIGISDHSQSAFYVNGLKEDRIRTQWAEIEQVQKKYTDIHIFKGIEADILPDGAMDYPDELLAQFDFVIASVHSRFNLSEEEQTRRICRAVAHPFVTMLGHPTGRLLLSRAGYRVDLARVLETAATHGKMIEINGSRHRLDLDWRWGGLAKTHGVRLCVNPDAHAVQELSNVALGVNVARKAGLGSQDVANTLSLADMATLLRRRRVHIPPPTSVRL